MHPMAAIDLNFTRPRVPFNCETMAEKAGKGGKNGCGPGTKRTPKKSCAIDESIVNEDYNWIWMK